jgi:uncharacterized protein YbbC (DUF1343 family)
MKLLHIIIFLGLGLYTGQNTTRTPEIESRKPILTGADQVSKYLPYLKGKRVAILANPTSVIGRTHLVDSLKRYLDPNMASAVMPVPAPK